MKNERRRRSTSNFFLGKASARFGWIAAINSECLKRQRSQRVIHVGLRDFCGHCIHAFRIPNVLAHVFDMHPLLERFFYLQFRANRRSTRADSLEYCSEKGDTREVQSQVQVERERLFGSDAPLSWRIRHRRREGLKFAYLCAKTRNRGSRKVAWL